MTKQMTVVVIGSLRVKNIALRSNFTAFVKTNTLFQRYFSNISRHASNCNFALSFMVTILTPSFS